MASGNGKRERILKVIGIAATFSGAALLVNILLDISLPLALSATGLLLIVSVVFIWRRAESGQRQKILHLAKAGFLAGIVALIAYDSSKWLLSQLDPSPYNPFEAIRIFGVLLTDATASEVMIMGVGTSFHVLNGIFFGIAFAFLFGRRGVFIGIAWGLFLELFQLTLYPGWLKSGFYKEFVQISVLAHVVYGGMLGLVCRYLLRDNSALRHRNANTK